MLLRDPVARFESAMRLRLSQSSFPGLDAPWKVLDRWVRMSGSDQLWAGMYATQLAAWRRFVPVEQMMGMQYEQVATGPLTALTGVWHRLGLDPVALPATVDQPSATASVGKRGFVLPDELRRNLQDIYRPEVRDLAAGWGIDPILWNHTTT